MAFDGISLVYPTAVITEAALLLLTAVPSRKS